MSKSTYYVVQIAPLCYVRDSAMFASTVTRDAEKATRFTLPEAMSVYKTACRNATADTPRRFPRIVKVTVETKTIKDRR